MYFLFRSIYTSVGWGQRALYNGLKSFIDDETKLKIVLAGEQAPPQLLEQFHPSQLEKRFGGTAETPTNFWPPPMGPTFITEEEKANFAKNTINASDYERILAQNPELHCHPAHLRPGITNINTHFVCP